MKISTELDISKLAMMPFGDHTFMWWCMTSMVMYGCLSGCLLLVTRTLNLCSTRWTACTLIGTAKIVETSGWWMVSDNAMFIMASWNGLFTMVNASWQWYVILNGRAFFIMANALWLRMDNNCGWHLMSTNQVDTAMVDKWWTWLKMVHGWQVDFSWVVKHYQTCLISIHCNQTFILYYF